MESQVIWHYLCGCHWTQDNIDHVPYKGKNVNVFMAISKINKVIFSWAINNSI